MSLNSDLRLACIEAGFNKSCFTGEMHNWNDLQVCHILSKSKTTLNAIKKAYNCSSKTAELIMNMPLLNTVIGSRQDNAEYKKTDKITYIDKKLCQIAYSIFKDNQGKLVDIHSRCITDFYLFMEFIDKHNSVLYSKSFEKYISNDDLIKIENAIITETIKDIQLQFHREINLHT